MENCFASAQGRCLNAAIPEDLAARIRTGWEPPSVAPPTGALGSFLPSRNTSCQTAALGYACVPIVLLPSSLSVLGSVSGFERVMS